MSRIKILSATAVGIVMLSSASVRGQELDVEARASGLTGTFDLVLKFNPDANNTSSELPSLFAAVQEQLGLKLDPQTAPAQVLVVDRVEKPTEN